MDRNRIGYCYKYSGDFVTNNPVSVLVHGTIRGLNYPPIDHAWVSVYPLVWEPVTNKFYSAEEFACLFNPVEHRRYTWEQSVDNMINKGHYGPWDDTDG